MRILFSVSFLLSVSACTINAPQVEDVEGAALSVVDGRLEIDAKQVPVLTECEIGQLVSKTSAGWVCVDAGVTDVVAGAGLTGGGTGVSNVAVDFGNGASQVATGERATTLEARLTAAESDVAAHSERLTAVDGTLTPVGGSLAIGEQLVPLLADCALGELVARTEVGWECVERGVTNVVLGAGLTGGGTGVSNVAVDFGDSASQVATGARAKALEDNLTPLSGSLAIGPVGATQQLVPLLADCAAGALVARTAVGWECVERGVTAIEAGSGLSKSGSAGVSTLSVIFGDAASQVATGARANALEDDALRLRAEFDDLVLRVDVLEPPTVPLIIAKFRGEDINDVSNLWQSAGGEAVIALSSEALVTSAGNTSSIRAGVLTGSGGFGGGLGLTRIALPPSNFSVEMLVNNTGCIFTHGLDSTPMSLKVCIGAAGGVTVTEGLVNIFTVPPPTLPDMGLGTRVVHLVYVHDDTGRRLYINGFLISLSPHIAGPYQGGDAPLLLGEHSFAASNNTGVIIHDLVFHGVALTTDQVRTACASSTPRPDFCSQ